VGDEFSGGDARGGVALRRLAAAAILCGIAATACARSEVTDGHEGGSGGGAGSGSSGHSGGGTAGGGTAGGSAGAVGAGGSATGAAGGGNGAAAQAGSGGGAGLAGTGGGAGSAGSSGAGGTTGRGGSGGMAGNVGGRGGGGVTGNGGGVGGGGNGGNGGNVGNVGSSGTGGAGGVAGGGSAGMGGPSLCAPGKYLICEGFEGAAVGTNVAPAGWSRTGAVDVIADAANVYRGAHAMRINAAESGPRRIVKTGADIAALGNGHWGRIFYKFQTPAPVSCDSCCGNVLHSTLVELAGVGPAGGAGDYRVVDTVENLSGMHQFLYNIQYSGNEVGRASAYSYKYDGKWHCAEWHIDNPTQAFQFYIDGTQVSLPGSAALDVPPSFTQLRVGLYNYQKACSPYLVTWIDEIALDKSRIGCGN